MTHASWLMAHGFLQLSLDFDLFVTLDYVAYFDIIEVVNVQSAFKA